MKAQIIMTEENDDVRITAAKARALMASELPTMKLLAHLSDVLNVPVFHKKQWVLGYEDGQYGYGAGSGFGLTGVVRAHTHHEGVLHTCITGGLVRQTMPSLIGQALMANKAILVEAIDGHRLTIAQFGLTFQSPSVVLTLNDHNVWELEK